MIRLIHLTYRIKKILLRRPIFDLKPALPCSTGLFCSVDPFSLLKPARPCSTGLFSSLLGRAYPRPPTPTEFIEGAAGPDIHLDLDDKLHVLRMVRGTAAGPRSPEAAHV